MNYDSGYEIHNQENSTCGQRADSSLKTNDISDFASICKAELYTFQL